MDALCKLNKRCSCKDNGCARSLARLERRERESVRGHLKSVRKAVQRAFPPGSCGIHQRRFFTVIGWGQLSDGRWTVLVSFNGSVVPWDWDVLARLTPA